MPPAASFGEANQTTFKFPDCPGPLVQHPRPQGWFCQFLSVHSDLESIKLMEIAPGKTRIR